MGADQRNDARVAVVTGASAGIGRAIAKEFAQHGWRVALLARGSDGREGARAGVERLGGEALVVPCDVADEAQVEAAAVEVEKKWGSIEVWVNGAMATIFSNALLIPAVDFRRATEVTYLGAVWGTMAALKRMMPRDRGCTTAVACTWRDLWVGWPAVQAILGTRVLPGLLDRVLGHTAVDGQHTDESIPAGRQDNPWHPVPCDYGAHGRFDAGAKHSSLQYWLTTHRWTMAIGTLVLLVAVSVWLAALRG